MGGEKMVNEYIFSADWFSGHIPKWDVLIAKVTPRRILEIGSYEGRSACYLIESQLPKHDLEIHCVDTWEGGIEHDHDAMGTVEANFDRNVEIARVKAANRLTLHKHKSSSIDALSRLVAQGFTSAFDLIYVDGSHQAPDVLADAVLSFRLLRVGGLLIFDDYHWNPHHVLYTDIVGLPKIAIDAFMNIYCKKCQVISEYSGYQLYVAKFSE